MLYGLLSAYKLVRLLARGQVGEAFANARSVMRLERHLGIFTEADLQRLVIHSETAVRLVNTYYARAHIPATAVCLLALYFFRPNAYRSARRVLITMTSLALVIHLVYPLAPPRMHPWLGFIDTGLVFGPSPYGKGSVFAGIANQMAAMPSMHFGWAVLVAWAAIRFTRTRWRWLVIIHPILTLLAIVLTANHFWLDAVVAGVLFLVALRLDAAWEHRRIADRRVAGGTIAVPGS